MPNLNFAEALSPDILTRNAKTIYNIVLELIRSSTIPIKPGTLNSFSGVSSLELILRKDVIKRNY
jgi:hypothetical protein